MRDLDKKIIEELTESLRSQLKEKFDSSSEFSLNSSFLSFIDFSSIEVSSIKTKPAVEIISIKQDGNIINISMKFRDDYYICEGIVSPEDKGK
jgi:hypothetical protein